MSAEQIRLDENRIGNAIWHRWGPYMSERHWGTVREDFSKDGNAWDYITHEQSRYVAYRFGEDGIAGICDRHMILCFGFAMWNGKDPFLKERIYGLSNSQGNHGEDVKDYYYYLDSTPTHSYMKYLYKYPQNEFPYQKLVDVNHQRGLLEPEYELIDTGIFDYNEYFDFYVEYAKAEPEDILIRVKIYNRGPEKAPITVIPQLWFRNTWTKKPEILKPKLWKCEENAIQADTVRYGNRYLMFEGGQEFLFTDNETNLEKYKGTPNQFPHVKDAFHEYVVRQNKSAVNKYKDGTKGGRVYQFEIEPGETEVIKLRLAPKYMEDAFGRNYDMIFEQRAQESDEFYNELVPGLDENAAKVCRQGLAGLMWTKQYFCYPMQEWLKEGKDIREHNRNEHWTHFYADEVLSMPDKWEYPWFAAWDTAFHCIPLAMVDPEFAKGQLISLVREWYMHPNGQLPAYEWNFGDVNPPVHAWAAFRVYRIEQQKTGRTDVEFLSQIFHKLLLNFTWWINQKDKSGHNVFEGGFLGLDNIGVFDRNTVLPNGMILEQSDATSWMAMYCLNMLSIALELAKYDHSYSNTASKFFEHFIYISDAMNDIGERSYTLWDEEDGFYYDAVRFQDKTNKKLKVRSLVGLLPLLAVTTIEPDVLKNFPSFKRRMDWFVENRPDLADNIDLSYVGGMGKRMLLSLVRVERLHRVLSKMLDENEFLSPYGIRSLSKFHKDNPYELEVEGQMFTINYQPGDSESRMFGGNSNWRGPIWFPINFLLVDALQKFDVYFGEGYKIEYPTRSGNYKNLWEISMEIQKRLISIMMPGSDGKKPFCGDNDRFNKDEHWKDSLLFYEFFHGDTGKGIGASHQTGWTGLISRLIERVHLAELNPTKERSERRRLMG